MWTTTVKSCIGTHVRKHTSYRNKQNTTTSHVAAYCTLFLFWVHIQEGLDVTTSDFNTYTVPTYHMESEEDLLARVMAAADVGLPSIGDRVYQNMVRVCAEVLLVSEPRRKTTCSKQQK